MPDLSTKLGIPLPLGNENVNRANYREALEAIENNAAAENEVIKKFIATDADQILVSSGAGAWAAKTLAQFKSWLGLGSAAYTDSGNYATANHNHTYSAITDFVASVRSTVLTGLSTATSDAITAADSILGALGKLQAQVTAHLAGADSHITATERTAWNGKQTALGYTPLDVAGSTAMTGQLKSSVATGTAPLIIASTTKVVNLNVDKVDGYDAGNASGNIPVSNGNLCVNLNSQYLNGKQNTDFQGSTKVYGSAIYTDSMPPLSTIIKTIPLGGNYKFGIATFYGSANSPPGAGCGGIMASFETNNLKTRVVGPSYGGSFIPSAWTREMIGAVTKYTTYNNSFGHVAGFSTLTIDECYINGQNLVITFRNNVSDSAFNLSTTLYWEV